jgi:hypothetical protein
MSNIKRWIICAFLFFICFFILKFQDRKNESFQCGCNGKSKKISNIPKYYGGYSNGNPFYYYSDSDYINYYFPESKWYIYKPFSTYY